VYVEQRSVVEHVYVHNLSRRDVAPVCYRKRIHVRGGYMSEEEDACQRRIHVRGGGCMSEEDTCQRRRMHVRGGYMPVETRRQYGSAAKNVQGH
jgi:hypothetical protein